MSTVLKGHREWRDKLPLVPWGWGGRELSVPGRRVLKPDREKVWEGLLAEETDGRR